MAADLAANPGSLGLPAFLISLNGKLRLAVASRADRPGHTAHKSGPGWHSEMHLVGLIIQLWQQRWLLRVKENV
jgi:hypothetical protein